MNRIRTTVAALAITWSAAGAVAAAGQVPADYPWHDRIAPGLTATVTLDAATGEFVYRYNVENGAAAEQRIASLVLELAVPATGASAPADWEVSYDAPPAHVQWYAAGTVDPAWVEAHAGDLPSFTSEIAPGSALDGFEVRHGCAAAGAATYRARGYNHVYAVAPDDDPPEVPTVTEDAVSGTVVGPGDCSVVRDWGNRRPAVDGFVGLVNFAGGDALPAGPVTVQLRFSRAGEQVDEASLSVVLNRTDVTAWFLTNPAGDRVAVFAPGTSPLTSGTNVLLVSVDGVVPGTTRTASDSDRFTFTIP